MLFRGLTFRFRHEPAFGVRICEKSVSFARRNPKFGAKLAIAWGNEPFDESLEFSMLSLSSILNVEP